MASKFWERLKPRKGSRHRTEPTDKSRDSPEPPERLGPLSNVAATTSSPQAQLDRQISGDNVKPRAPNGPAVAVQQPPATGPATPPLATEDDRPAAKTQLWTRAYDAIKDDDPKLVAAYEAVLLSELRPEPVCGVGEGGGDNPEDARRQMDNLVREGLRRTERAAAKMDNIHEGMRIVSSVKAFIGTAVKHAPEAVAAWAGICLLFGVGMSLTGKKAFLTFLDS